MVYDTNPPIRDACDKSICSRASTIEVDIAEAMQKYGIDADWTAEGLALYTQAVLQGPSFLQRPKAALKVAVACVDHLHRYIEMLSANLTQGERFMTESKMQAYETSSEKLEAPRFVDEQSRVIAGLRGHYTRETMKDIPSLWERFVPYLGRISGQVGVVTYGVCFPSSDGFDYLSGVEVLSSLELPADFSVVTMPVQRYAVFAHRGQVSKLHATCDAIEREWLPKSQYAFAHGMPGAPGFFERYGEDFDPRTGSGDVEVWVPIK